MNTKIYLIPITLIFLLLNPSQAKSFTFLTHFIKPFSYLEKSEFQGFAVDIVRELMKRIGHPENFKMYPFKRALLTVQKTPSHALFIVARRPEREGTVKWVGPLISSGVYFYKKRGSDFHIEKLDDLKNLNSIGVGRGNADHTFLQNHGFTNLLATKDQKQSVQLLEYGRTDVTPISELVMPEMAKEAGIDINGIERTDLKLYDSVLYLVFSIDTPDETVAQWQEALDALKSSGEYQQIFNRYIQ